MCIYDIDNTLILSDDNLIQNTRGTHIVATFNLNSKSSYLWRGIVQTWEEVKNNSPLRLLEMAITVNFGWTLGYLV